MYVLQNALRAAAAIMPFKVSKLEERTGQLLNTLHSRITPRNGGSNAMINVYNWRWESSLSIENLHVNRTRLARFRRTERSGLCHVRHPPLANACLSALSMSRPTSTARPYHYNAPLL